MDEIPDKWIIVRFKSKEYGEIDKILAGWFGGYCGSSSWQMSSGICGTETDPDNSDLTIFVNKSGSKYHCFHNCEGTSGYTAGVLNDMKKTLEELAPEASIEVIRQIDWKPLYD